MVITRKKTKKDSVEDLISSLGELIFALEEQKELEVSFEDLKIVKHDFERYQLKSLEFETALQLLINSFDTNSTLNTIVNKQDKKSSRVNKWSDEDHIFLLASKVMGLAHRLK